eukprot:m.23477 g.23477  ORF g.23477 m.23477 type:complete len:58 (-) comp12944_c0_seq1:57-230(-)
MRHPILARACTGMYVSGSARTSTHYNSTSQSVDTPIETRSINAITGTFHSAAELDTL